MSLHSICVVGAESTGKSWLAGRIAAHHGIMPISEYARDYCARHGNDLSMEQLVHIGQIQDSNIRGSIADAWARGGVMMVVADTDAVTTAVWADQLHGRRDPWFDGNLFGCDLTLVMDNDLPWQDDGVRVQRDERIRDRFRQRLIAELDRRRRPWVAVGGLGYARLSVALSAIEQFFAR